MLALVMVGSAMLIAPVLQSLRLGYRAHRRNAGGGHDLHPVLVGAGDTLRHFGLPSDQLAQSLDHLSLGYALTYPGRPGESDRRRPLYAQAAASGSADQRPANRS